MIDGWNNGPQTWVGNTAIQSTGPGSWHKIRIEFFDYNQVAYLHLYSRVAGDFAYIPGGNYRPRYDLVTSTVDPDGKKTATQYGPRPELRLAHASIVDPGGLNLTTSTTYEPEFFRRSTKTLPRGPSSTITDTYYGNSEAPAPPSECTTTAVNQAGLKKTNVAANPDGAGSVRRSSYYDIMGRPIGSYYDITGQPIGSPVQGDARWSCVTYDARGRVVQSVDRAGRVSTNDYATPGVVVVTAPDSAGVMRTTRSEVDLLGRAVRYTDELGTVTRSVFDQVGRLVSTYRTFTGQAEMLLTSFTYDPAGRVLGSTEYVSGVARTTTNTYDGLGRLVMSGRPNGVITTTAYDPSSGRAVGLSNKTAAGPELSDWTYGFSVGGRVASEASTAAGRTRSFFYDGASRLIHTVETGATPAERRYAFDANTNRCANAPDCAVPSFVYDNADRLTASPYGSDYVYDTHGNLTSYRPAGAPSDGTGDVSIAYDAFDHATRIVQPATPCVAPPLVGVGAGRGWYCGFDVGPTGVDVHVEFAGGCCGW